MSKTRPKEARPALSATDKELASRQLLKELAHWRRLIASSMLRCAGGSDLSGEGDRQLDLRVQQIIDGLLYLRLGERAGLEPRGQLLGLARRAGIHRELMKLLRSSEQVFLEDPAGGVEDAALAEIIERLHCPRHAVESALTEEILGLAYEQSLGLEIRGRRGDVTIRARSDAKRAKGVFYTPRKVTDYIVEQTLARACQGKSLGQVKRLRLLDPACGSGAFLLGAYEDLLRWHLSAYLDQRRRTGKIPRRTYVDTPGARGRQLAVMARRAGDSWALCTHERVRILRQHIFGLDLDPHAAEVARRSLLLRALTCRDADDSPRDPGGEHVQRNQETDQLRQKTDQLRQETDQLRQETDQLRQALERNIRCGDSLMQIDELLDPVRASGEFDVVIGNPPYRFITGLEATERRRYIERYECATYRFDLYGLFIELAVKRLLARGGRLGFIVPHSLLSNDSFSALRRLLLERTSIEVVVDIGPGIFEGASTETMILVLRLGHGRAGATRVVRTTARAFPAPTTSSTVDQARWRAGPGYAWSVRSSPEELATVEQMERCAHRLGELCSVNQGLRTGDNARLLSTSKRAGRWERAAGGRHIRRYAPIDAKLFVLYDPRRLDAPRRPEIFSAAEKIVVQEIRNITLPRRLVATLDRARTYCLQSTNVINLLDEHSARWSLRYLLAVVNSAPVNFYFSQRFSGNNHIATGQLRQIPVPSADKAAQAQIDSLVEQLIHLEAEPPTSVAGQRRTERGAAALNQELDQLIGELYALNADQLALVEPRGPR